MNKPILVIDEKPFLKEDEIAKSDFRRVKASLEAYGGIELVEFAWENDLKWKLPPVESVEFKSLVADRNFLFVHNSYPDSKDPNPIFSDAKIPELRSALPSETVLVRFSGNMAKRDLPPEDFKKYHQDDWRFKTRIIIEDLRIDRFEIYNHLDVFVRHWKSTDFEAPFYHILRDGHRAFVLRAREYLGIIKKQVLHENQSIRNIMLGKKEIVPIEGWQEKVGDEPFTDLLALTGKPKDWIRKTQIRIRERKENYKAPEDYIYDIQSIIKIIETRAAV
jgi:hypothetical protein